MGIQKAPYQKTYELQTGSQEFTVDFKGCERQLDWLEISLVYDKSDKHFNNLQQLQCQMRSKDNKNY